MGSPEYETGRSNDEIMHEVTLTKGFYMHENPGNPGAMESCNGG